MRGGLFVIALLLSTQASAAWLDWWRNADQQGKALIDAGDPTKAAQVFDDPNWRGAAHFQAGEYQHAADAFAQEEGIEPLYNRATSLAHAGELQQSLDAFDKLLQQQPDHEDGAANREWVKKQLEQQQEQQQQQNSDGDDPQDQQQDESQQADNKQTEEGSEQQQEGGTSKLDDGRKMSDNSEANGQQGQQSAEESLKSALQNQQEPNAPQNAEPNREQNMESSDGASEVAQNEIPYSEASQAIEQQLQRIPDDPAGLLRNKLYVTHQTRHADVREGEKPW